jgi:hypothetical protein
MKQRITMVIVVAIVLIAGCLYRAAVHKLDNGKIQLQNDGNSPSLPFTGGGLLVEHFLY